MATPDDATLGTTRAIAVGTIDAIGTTAFLLRLGSAEPEVANAARANIEEGAVDLEAPLLDGVAHGRVGHEHRDAALDVELGEAEGSAMALIVVVVAVRVVELLAVRVAQRLQGHEPGVEHAADADVAEGGDGAAAPGVPAQHHVLDPQVHDGVLDDRRGVDVGRRHDVGDVAVDEDVARLQAQDRRLGAARVGAAEPDCVDHRVSSILKKTCFRFLSLY